MTRKLFWEDAYVREFDATICSLDGNQVVLDQTAFNPRGGGLVGDLGTLNGVKVLDTVKLSEEAIANTLETTAELSVGSQVHGVLDWDRRYKIMRMHTSAHLLSAIFHKETGALITGNQIEPDRSRIDFSLENFDKDKMLTYCARANEAISNNPSVKTYFMNREEALRVPGITKLASVMPPDVENLRIVEIEGYDLQADGGVHVQKLGELKRIDPLKFENKGKNNRRMYFTLQ
jgi:Ser-tRNA(Ala) deacylase AlaX